MSRNKPVLRLPLSGLRERLVRLQERLADYLGRKTQYWNRGSKLIALFLFCLIFGSVCLYLLMQAFINH